MEEHDSKNGWRTRLHRGRIFVRVAADGDYGSPVRLQVRGLLPACTT